MLEDRLASVKKDQWIADTPGVTIADVVCANNWCNYIVPTMKESHKQNELIEKKLVDVLAKFPLSKAYGDRLKNEFINYLNARPDLPF